jgi:sugar/nucleoside kinase (ribokinase family)
LSKKYDAISIGALYADILTRPVDETCFERDGTRLEQLKFMPGGDAQNVSITMTKLGSKVALCGLMGKDSFGDMVYSYTKGQGVDLSNVSRSEELMTNTSICLVKPDGQRHFLIKSECSENFSAEHFDMKLLEQTRLLSIGSMFNCPKFDGEPTAEILKRAKELGVITSSDTGTDWGLGLEGIKGALANLDYFIPSIYEVEELTGEKEPEKIADVLLDCGVKNVVIKLGKRGCFIKNREMSKYVDTYKATPIDTTGSGDNFVAGFLTAVLLGKSFEECAMMGNACGSINSMQLGATGAVKSLEQVEEFMRVTPFENA